jgi:5-methylcytosine-specific restriction endonuclease McrA
MLSCIVTKRAAAEQKLNYKTSANIQKKCLETYGSNCHLCNEAINLSATRKCGTSGWELGLHIDHVIAQSPMAVVILENVRPTHAICNLRKGKK